MAVSSTQPPRRVDALLFDLGQVLIGLCPERTAVHWGVSPDLATPALLERIHRMPAYLRHETGHADWPEFADALRDELAIETPNDRLLAGWMALLGAPVSGMQALLRRAAVRWPLFLLTNTNAEHQPVWQERCAGMLALFEQQFISCEIGLRKPDATCFRHVVAETGVPAERMLFFDDSLTNVEGAAAIGLQAVQVMSVACVERALVPRGLAASEADPV